jgi:LmbE family N-acetylglucosaminyl deacetylase
VTAFDSNPRLRWLFCMTHPDDEISICAWIHHLVQAGADVHLSWTHSTPVREREARAVALVLGVPTSNLHFFGATDGSAIDHIPELLPRFRRMMATVKPDRVACGAFEQGHIDHDTTNFLVTQSFDGPVFEIPFYHTYITRLQRLNRFADPTGEEVRRLTAQERKFKLHVARQYPSQNIWSVLLWYEVWQKARLRPMDLARSERMRLQRPTDYLQPGLPPILAAKVRKHPTWKRWETAMRLLKGMQAMRGDAGILEAFQDRPAAGALGGQGRSSGG